MLEVIQRSLIFVTILNISKGYLATIVIETLKPVKIYWRFWFSKPENINTTKDRTTRNPKSMFQFFRGDCLQGWTNLKSLVCVKDGKGGLYNLRTNPLE